VATFVKPGGALDSEAQQRGNSVYLPRVVLPMLPEILSNGICSLQPDVPRLTKSAIITYDASGQVINQRLANSVIQSNHRLTYLEAQALIDDKPDEARKHSRTDTEYSDQLLQHLQWTDMLARIIRKRRLGDGMITLDLPEVSLIFDDQGNVVDAEPEDDAFTHTIIEMFMVEANEAVARTFADLDVPLLRRIHPEPGAADRDELRQFARVAGYNIPANPSRKELQKLLDTVRGKPAARAVHLAILKTLTKAEYSPQLIGHFALASEHYAHFTSPIRRYPDLTVHRVLDALLAAHSDDKPLPRSQKMRKKLANQVKQDGRCLDQEKLVELGRHCSATERNAEAAERELRDLLVMQMLNEKHVGDTFSGTVTGVTGFGVFVQIDKYLVEGLIKTTDLPGARGEQWKLNEHAGSLTAQRSGHSITIGDQFKVQIVKVDLGRREMDLRILEPPRRSRTSTKPKRGGRPGKVVRRKRRKR
jgi:ribonuclease R